MCLLYQQLSIPDFLCDMWVSYNTLNLYMRMMRSSLGHSIHTTAWMNGLFAYITFITCNCRWFCSYSSIVLIMLCILCLEIRPILPHIIHIQAAAKSRDVSYTS